MKNSNLKLFTSESVTEGHPDKICDQISDAVLDALLAQDPNSRVAIETMVSTGPVYVAGEVSTEGYVDVENIVRDKLIEIGYDSARKGFDGLSCGIITSITSQSDEIARGVDNAFETREQGTEDSDGMLSQGAGDQGLMFGFASDENHNYMPTAIDLAHSLVSTLAEARKTSLSDMLYPDGKSQVVVGYNESGVPVSIEHVLISTQHSQKHEVDSIRDAVLKEVIVPTLDRYNSSLEVSGRSGLSLANLEVLINPAGAWSFGGPKADAGLTGRKIIVDTYGGFARHGGGNFHGKDPSKVDRSAAYMLRWVAKNAVAAGLAKRLEIQVSYAIGTAHPIALYVDSFGTGSIPDSQILEIIKNVFDFRPAAINKQLGLTSITNYQSVAKYGHFGTNAISLDMPWERLDKVTQLREAK
jgi:S-adenosylmethionine synthetase